MDIKLYFIINKRFKLENHPFDILVRNFTQTLMTNDTWRFKVTMFPNQSIAVYATDGKREYLQTYANMFDAVRLVYYLNLNSKF